MQMSAEVILEHLQKGKDLLERLLKKVKEEALLSKTLRASRAMVKSPNVKFSSIFDKDSR